MTYIYFVRDIAGMVKIGLSDNPSGRLHAMQVSNANKLTLELTIRFRNRVEAQEAETKLHHAYRKYRRSGEWFAIDIISIPQYVLKKSVGFDWHNTSNNMQELVSELLAAQKQIKQLEYDVINTRIANGQLSTQNLYLHNIINLIDGWQLFDKQELELTE